MYMSVIVKNVSPVHEKMDFYEMYNKLLWYSYPAAVLLLSMYLTYIFLTNREPSYETVS